MLPEKRLKPMLFVTMFLHTKGSRIVFKSSIASLARPPSKTHYYCCFLAFIHGRHVLFYFNSAVSKCLYVMQQCGPVRDDIPLHSWCPSSW